MEDEMKKFFMLSVVLIFLTAVLSAAADSVWMPMDDYFMNTWEPGSDSTCESQVRPYYLAAGERGYVSSIKTPLDRTLLTTYPNGTEFKISFICGKGNDLWGAVEAIRKNGEIAFTEDWKGESGYIAMKDLVRSYDSQAFMEDHQSEIHAFAEDGYDFCSGNELVLWSAPNSGVQLEYVNSDYISYLCMDSDPEANFKLYHFGAFYIDPEGKRWVEITLRRETENGWFCLDDLTGGGIDRPLDGSL